jgi:hypothetical protein
MRCGIYQPRDVDATRFNDPHIAKSNCVGASSVNLGSRVGSMYEVMRGNVPSSIVTDSPWSDYQRLKPFKSLMRSFNHIFQRL